MTITLFEDKDFRGRSLSVTRNFSSLKDTTIGNNPSSIRMGEGDAILLYKKEDWNGGVMFLRGGADVSDLGSAKDGGRALWGNAVTSVRITPFTVKLNVTVVTTEGGDLPGTGTSVTSITTLLHDAVPQVNQFFDDEKVLIDIEIARIVCRADKNKFDLSNWEAASFPGSWKNAGELDLIVVNSFNSGNVGMGKFPWWGNVAIIAMMSGGVNRSNAAIARTLAHEIGHYYGLTHETVPANIMTQSATGLPTQSSNLRVDQIEEIHNKLAGNLTRQGDRN